VIAAAAPLAATVLSKPAPRGARARLPPQRPRSHLMPSCPSDETLTGLLADALTTAERDSLARHVDGCAPCQERLGRCTRTSYTETWRRAGHPPEGSEAEEGVVRRLKRVPPSSQARRPGRADGPASDTPRAADPTLVAADSGPPAVPGYEI